MKFQLIVYYRSFFYWLLMHNFNPTGKSGIRILFLETNLRR